MADKIDTSSLSEAQQEQLQGLQEKFNEHRQLQEQQQKQQRDQYQHHQQQQQQQQQNQHHAYDPSQVQPYDANHAYYYHQQQQQQHYGYNQSGYPNPYQQQIVQHESVPVQPVQMDPLVGVAVSQEGTSQLVEGSGGAVGEAQLQPQQSVYNSQSLSDQHQRQATAAALAAIAANPGLNPAAAAAVSALAHLAQYAETMGAEERARAAMQLQQLLGSGEGFRPMMDQFFGPSPMVGQPYFFGGHGGRRDGGLFRGVNRGGSSSSPRGRGRGRGRGGKRRFASNSSPSKVSQPDPSAKVSEQKEEPSVAEGETETGPSASAPASVMINPHPGPSKAKWRCELCNSDCNSAEILEQHKNGKKHKKNMQKTREVTISAKPESQQEVDKVEQPTDSAQPSEGKSTVGTKRKLTSGRGRKRMRTGESSGHDPSKPKVVIPIMCDLCNIKCDTQEVFDIHLAGKKHISKLKRYEGHQAMYGPNVQALYPPNPIAQQPYYHPQAQQPLFNGTQSLYPPYDQCMPPQSHDPAAAPIGFYPPQNNTTIGTMPLNM